MLRSIRPIAKEGDKQMSDTPESRYAALARRVVEAHEAQPLRDLQIINERTVRELGPLPRDGLPVQVKRKPKRAPWEQPVLDTSTLDADAPAQPQAPLSDIGDSDMFKFNNPFKEKPIPPPPVPQKLREILKDYPELIERIQQQLNNVMQRPSKVPPIFEWAIWMLEDELSSFISEAREELRVAQTDGAPSAIIKAEEKERATRHARSRNRGMSDLNELWHYIEAHKESLK
ncbi:hypothetical protein [Xanthomonas fragariae]|uniref:hypothetical protein n=1 Tax=Xanthomonas fragariae TaxID=48664 RepID=UPI0003271B1A|nr:hypothetical protein [Xanthomonas fragariae]ENZ93830.1 hypothetical protein O1K_19546 [Xanthomonas fragariae LMG 25863]